MTYHPHGFNPRALADAIRFECEMMAVRMDKDVKHGSDPEAHSCHVVRRAVRQIVGYDGDFNYLVEHYTREYTQIFQPVEDMQYLCWLECTIKESIDFVPKHRMNMMQRAYWRIDALCMFAAMVELGDVV